MLDQETIDILKQYFVFDRIFDLIEYDLDMERLYNDLKSLRKDVFESNYRFIFLHYDTEYYVAPDMPGLTLMNLQKILESLDISNYFCLILTQQNLQSMCKQVACESTTESCSISAITSHLHCPIHPAITDINLDLNEKLISKKYISLNGVGRVHRRVLISLLENKNLLSSGMVSYLGK
jgi:hypothetical protein